MAEKKSFDAETFKKHHFWFIAGGVVLIASIVMLVNLGVDLLYGVINPRIRHRS